jgi:cell division protein DivIC
MKKAKSILKNKFFIATAFFVVWMGFFDPKDWSSIAEKKEKLHGLTESEVNLRQKIKDTRTELNQLKSSAKTIEQYARENYMMKKDNEDIFLVNKIQ